MSAATRLPSLAQPVAETRLSGALFKDLGHSFGETGKGGPVLKMCHVNGYFFYFYCFSFKKKIQSGRENKTWKRSVLFFLTSLFPLTPPLSAQPHELVLTPSTWIYEGRELGFPSHHPAPCRPKDSDQCGWLNSLVYMGLTAEVCLEQRTAEREPATGPASALHQYSERPYFSLPRQSVP